MQYLSRYPLSTPQASPLDIYMREGGIGEDNDKGVDSSSVVA